MWHCLQFVPQVTASQRVCVRDELGGEDTVISSPTIVLLTPPPPVLQHWLVWRAAVAGRQREMLKMAGAARHSHRALVS